MGVCSERVAPARGGCTIVSSLNLQDYKMAGRKPGHSFVLHYSYLRDDLRDRNPVDVRESHVTPVVAIG